MNSKKELYDSFTTSPFQGFAPDGEKCFYHIFENLDTDRAKQISGDIMDNIKDYVHDLTERERKELEGVAISPIDYLKICGRNIKLNDQLEVMHFIYVASSTEYQFKKLLNVAMLKYSLFGKGSDDNILKEIIETFKNGGNIDDLMEAKQPGFKEAYAKWRKENGIHGDEPVDPSQN